MRRPMLTPCNVAVYYTEGPSPVRDSARLPAAPKRYAAATLCVLCTLTCGFLAFVRTTAPAALAVDPKRSPTVRPKGSLAPPPGPTPMELEYRREKKELANKVVMSLATASVLTVGAMDLQVVTERQARLTRDAPPPVVQLQTAPSDAEPLASLSLPAPPLTGPASRIIDFSAIETPYTLLAIPILIIIGSSLWSSFATPSVSQSRADAQPLSPPPVDLMELPPRPPTPAGRPLPLADTPTAWGYVPKGREVFSIASGVVLTLGLQAAGQIHSEGVFEYLVPFCYGAALASLYDAVAKSAFVRDEQSKRSMRVVVTGSTRGVGKALVRDFLLRGDRVVVTARSPKAVEATLEELRASIPGCVVEGIASDVSNGDDVTRLAKFAVEQWGGVDLWINNAGTISQKKEKLTDLSQQEILNTVQTNLAGSLLCTQAALKIMQKQGHGHIFNMDGAGATGDATPLYATYGSTKAALVQLTKTLCKESANTGVGVHLLSPGMVLTDILLTGASSDNLRAFNILAELPENVSAWLVPRIRTARGTGQYIRYLTNARVIGRMLTFPFRWDRFFDKDGNVMFKPEQERLYAAETQVGTTIEMQNLTIAYALSMASLFWTMSKVLNSPAFAALIEQPPQ